MLTTNFVPGTPNWLDLGTRDVDAAARFYSAVLGWTFASAGPDAGGYGFFQQNGQTVAAAGPLTEEGAQAAWTVYFMTRDADATRDAVEQAGGTVRMQPGDVFTAGRMAAFTDPTGAEFAVWQPGDISGLDTVTEPGTLCWTELYTTDLAEAREFYRSVFSWSVEEMPMGDVQYGVVSAPGGGTGGDTAHGGLLELQEEHLAAGSSSEWHPYFEVTDCDTAFNTALQYGATTLIPPMNVPTVGRMAMATDPDGAAFALIKGDAEMS